VQSYSLDFVVNRVPTYNFGNRYPDRVETIYPIETNLSFTFDYNDYSAQNMRKFPWNERIDNISITIKDLELQRSLVTYSTNNMTLVKEQVRSDVRNPVSVTVQYKGYLI
jgi:hypothetical protein